MTEISIKHSNADIIHKEYSESYFLKQSIEMQTKRNTMQIIADIKKDKK